MGRTLRRYLLSETLTAVIVCIAGICALYVVTNAIGKLDDFIRHMKTPRAVVLAMLRYYLLHAPLMAEQAFPFTVVLGTMAAAARMVKRREFVTMKAAGVCVQWVVVYMMLPGVLLTCLALGMREYLLPAVRDDIARSERSIRLKKRVAKRRLTDLMLRCGGRTYVALGWYDTATGACGDAWILSREPRLRIRYVERGEVLEKGGLVVSRGYELGEFGATKLRRGTLMGIPLRREDVMAAAAMLEHRSFSELAEMAARNPWAVNLPIMLYKRLTFLLSGVVLAFVGLSLMLAREDVNLSHAVGLAMLCTFTYFLLDELSCEAARQGLVDPLLGCWAPLGVLASVGTLIFARVRT